ncbi:MAG: hypothetical protein WCJ66_07760 [Verrucomicrobiota bacterium]
MRVKLGLIIGGATFSTSEKCMDFFLGDSVNQDFSFEGISLRLKMKRVFRGGDLFESEGRCVGW